MLDKNRFPHYADHIHPNGDYHHGQIFPAKGVKNYQVTRANRSHPELADGTTSTYKHAADLAYFANRFYVQYLVNPSDEHTDEGYSILAGSDDGQDWSSHQISFPPYQIPACTIVDYKNNEHSFDGTTYAYMHQRMSFYQAKNGRMLVLGFYGWSPKPWITNWDNYGIGRVVRELYPDGSLGEIYFILPNLQAGWSLEQLNYPLYTEAKDLSFQAICEELLTNRLYTQQWAEENGDQSNLIQIKHPEHGTYQAFCWYHIDPDTIIGLWKHALVARSDDNGQNWSEVKRSPSLVMSGQKVWAEQTADGRFAMVYTPTLETQHRYPLCMTTSTDGLAFTEMRLVHGEVPPMRFKGFWKDLGPQYMRGITEGNEKSPDGDLWVAYTVNKEDVWVARIPVPIEPEELNPDLNECFENEESLAAWNLYAPKWAKVHYHQAGGYRALRLNREDSYDYSRAERILKPSSKKTIQFQLKLNQLEGNNLQVELLDAKAIPAIRLVFRPDGQLYTRTVTEIAAAAYKVGEPIDLEIELDCAELRYTLKLDGELLTDDYGETKRFLFMAATNEVSRFVLRTDETRRMTSLNDDPEGNPVEPLDGADEKTPLLTYDLIRFRSRNHSFAVEGWGKP